MGSISYSQIHSKGFGFLNNQSSKNWWGQRPTTPTCKRSSYEWIDQWKVSYNLISMSNTHINIYRKNKNYTQHHLTHWPENGWFNPTVWNSIFSVRVYFCVCERDKGGQKREMKSGVELHSKIEEAPVGNFFLFTHVHHLCCSGLFPSRFNNGKTPVRF